jgi:apolipoprotein N-acyltransferase
MNLKAPLRFPISQVVATCLVAIISGVLFVLAFPPFTLAEGGYLYAVPLILWLQRGNWTWRRVIPVWITGWVVWVALLIWLRHVTWGGMLGLSAILAVFWCLFPVAGALCVRRCRFSSFPVRIIWLMVAAAIAVIAEYLRGIVMTGFPWLPLAASQWSRPALLQVLEFTGSWGLSFVLYFFNAAVASYLLQWNHTRETRKWRLHPEILIALVLTFSIPFFFYQREIRTQQREPWLTVGVVQPYIPSLLKWDASAMQNNCRILWEEAMRLQGKPLDLVLMPEAVLPFPLSNYGLQEYLEAIADELETPVLTGAVTEVEDRFYTGAVLVEPNKGLSSNQYRKRKLVPFGEYVPWGKELPWVQAFLPIEFGHGESDQPIPITVHDNTYYAGILVCYEDVFSYLARNSVREGADFFFVATNNAWYGEEAGAYQHAIHSILRAVETRRPVVRAGNGGWSGWCDEYGILRDSPLEQDGTIYFRGVGILSMDRDMQWVGRQTFYVQHGDWFVLLCALGVGIVLLPTILRIGKRPSGAHKNEGDQ